MRRHQLAQMLIIGAIASAIGIVVALAIDWFPVQASKQAHEVDTLFDVLLIVSVPIFVLVQVVVLFNVWKFRMRPGQELEDGPPIHGNTRLEVLWTAVPAILLVSLCSYAYTVLRDVEKKHPNALRVTVTGQQFTWTFSYPGASGKTVSSPQLYLPKDRPVYFDIKSRDVIHSFFVPAFRIKQDAVPGITTHTRTTPNRLGSYPVVCAELCGLGHAVMRQTVHVITPAAFQRWLGSQGAPAGGPGGGAPMTAAAGKQIFTKGAEPACASCHTLAEAGASGKIGPDLDKVLKGKAPDFIQTSILKPDAFVEKGFSKGIMPPNYGDTLSPQQIKGLVDYLTKATK